MPCTEKRARLLLARGRARVHRVVPFVIRLVDRTMENCVFQPLQIKIDPGSRTTGLALVRVRRIDDEGRTHLVVLSLMHLVHRVQKITEALTQRRMFRKRRRAQLRFRPQRGLNRGTYKKGWLPPSRLHLVNTSEAWVIRLARWFPVHGVWIETVRFDMNRLQAIDGHLPHNGQSFDVREYLLEKWDHRCAYCDVKRVALNIEHIRAKARGGSDRLSNLAIACVPCNQKKGSRSVEEFLAHQPQRLQGILAQLRKPLKDAAAVNATRIALLQRLNQRFPESVETGTGSNTRANRLFFDLPKDHALDAVCVGHVGDVLQWKRPVLAIHAMGRGAYRRTRLDKYGFPRGYLMKTKKIHGFQTGDRVKVVITEGKKQGTYVGRVAVRIVGKFNIQTNVGLLQGIWHKRCTLVQRGDGYGYHVMGRVDRQSMMA